LLDPFRLRGSGIFVALSTIEVFPMKKSDIWMPMYIGDLLADTQHLTNEQFGAYHRLLYHQWRHGHFSEDELLEIARLSSFESASSTIQAELRQGVSRVLAPIKQMLKKDESEAWFSPRCDIEKEKWTHKKEVFTERARKGGLAKAKRMRELMAKVESENPASSSASSVLEHVLDGYTSPSDKEQKQKQPTPTPPAAQEGISASSTPMLQASSSTIAPAAAPANKRKKSETANLGPTAGQNEQQGGNHRQSSRSSVAPGRNLLPRYSKNGAQPQKTDSREERFKGEVFGFWAGQNPEGPKCPWGGSDERALGDLLNNNRELSFEEFKRLLRNRASSEINPAAPPYKWLRSVLEYSAGPLGKFGKPLKPARHL
jgi:uncharacterized protein YdaU (DUF1376 family)